MIIGRQSGLGKGLGALIPNTSPQTHQTLQPVAASVAESSVPSMAGGDDSQRVLQIPVGAISPNPHQPRLVFDHDRLDDLIASIKEHGVLQPLIVSSLPNGTYQLIAGERRLRASTLAGLATVPAIVRSASEQQSLEWAIIENVQRHDLNPMEEAHAYTRLMDEFNLTQEQVALKVGKSRSFVGNITRLLQLPAVIQVALSEGKISSSHARTLLALPTEREQLDLFQAMVDGRYSVRRVEDRVPHPRRAKLLDPNITAVEDRLRSLLGARVQIKHLADGSGELKITFHSDEEMDALLRKLNSIGGE